MARKTGLQKYILSAGEVGAYTVCPEAWRLKAVERERGAYSPSIEEGRRQHQAWVARVEENISLKRYARYLMLLLAVVVAFFCLVHQ